MAPGFAQRKKVRHTRILDIRKLVEKGWNMKQLLYHCENNLGVGRVTAVSYIDEAAAPHREKYQKEQDNAI